MPNDPQLGRCVANETFSDIQISFDYQGLALEAETDAFEESFRNVQFDDVLKYVAFPAVRVLNWPPNSLRRGPSEAPPQGRTDMLYFFKWLRETKKVKRILKVIVEDNKDPHTDEAIEESLKTFGVEVLDWSKPDLDPETICRASSELTEIMLHWGGNNAVLRAWSEPEGLRKLRNLTLINLVVDGVSFVLSRTTNFLLYLFCPVKHPR